MSQTFSLPPAWGTVGDFSDNPTYTVGSTLNVRWSTDDPGYQVYIWQQSLQEGSAVVSTPLFTKVTGAKEPGGFRWKIGLMTFELSQSNVFFLALGPNSTLQGSFLSHYFNLTEAAEDAASSTTFATFSSTSFSTTLSTSTVAAMTIPTTTTGTTATSVNTVPPSIAAIQTNNSFGHTGLALGLALGLGIPIVLLLALLVFRRTKRHPSRSIPSPGGIEVASPYLKSSPVYTSEKQNYHPSQQAELEARIHIGRQYASDPHPPQYHRHHTNEISELPA